MESATSFATANAWRPGAVRPSAPAPAIIASTLATKYSRLAEIEKELANRIDRRCLTDEFAVSLHIRHGQPDQLNLRLEALVQELRSLVDGRPFSPRFEHPTAGREPRKSNLIAYRYDGGQVGLDLFRPCRCQAPESQQRSISFHRGCQRH